MWQYAVKIVVTSIIIVAVSEIAKRNSFWAAILASLPLTSLLAFIWMYVETGDTKQIAALSQGIFWLVIPSLALFLLLPILLRIEWNFWLSLALSCVATASAYYLMVWLLTRLGIKV
ncbi:DUF3147 family protein [Oxalobacteraceae bacterium R-40]|uniref:DUF3147 family protein n=1 Tax=Keguizhuia sedimenti TaxID=3064264 RepID=A0ABU1BNA4_9BURK|nr:DUF3147 family protein [Oxalobacteraceae bacterium R-40]